MNFEARIFTPKNILFRTAANRIIKYDINIIHIGNIIIVIFGLLVYNFIVCVISKAL